MPIMWTHQQSRRRQVGVLLTTLAIWGGFVFHDARADGAGCPEVRVTKASTLVGYVSAAKQKPQRLHTDTSLKKVLRDASHVSVVGGKCFSQQGVRYIMLAIETPSTSNHGSGFCGAGSEDRLMLLKWGENADDVRFSDELKVQSCLDSYELVSVQGTGLKDAINLITDPAAFSLKWLSHPQYGSVDKKVTIQGGKFKVSE